MQWNLVVKEKERIKWWRIILGVHIRHRLPHKDCARAQGATAERRCGSQQRRSREAAERSIWWRREEGKKKQIIKRLERPVCSYLYRWPTVLEFGLSLRCLEHLYDYSLNMLHFYPHDQAGPSSLTGFTLFCFFFSITCLYLFCNKQKKVCNTHCVCTQSVVGCRIQPRNVPEATAACQTDLKANPREARCRGTCKITTWERDYNFYLLWNMVVPLAWVAWLIDSKRKYKKMQKT